MRPEPDESVGRGYGAGLVPTPDLVTPFPVAESAEPWTKHARVSRLVTDYNVRCEHKVRLHGTDGMERICNALLALRLTRPYTIGCRKCKNETVREAEE